jgi:phage shock protein PspC (stress-responsive transcriptional regulator)
MKKTINISLAGISFIAEDDAYHRLDEYLNSLRKHFATFPDAEEIVRDIEARFAEQFSGKAGGVQAITLAEVENLIASMGSPEQFGDEQQEKKEESSGKDAFILGKKLYRNPDDAIIAGVASGIAAYFGVDAIWIRLLFVLVTFATGFGILIYIVMWVLMPEAKTETEKMQMRGEPVNLKNLEQTIKERAEELKKSAPEGARKMTSEASAATARAAKASGEVIKKIFSVFF